MSEETTSESNEAGVTEAGITDDEGPGWMPIVMACTLLMGILGFIGCGLTTWLLFQKRGELAIRTVRVTLIPELEQSLLNPNQKQAVIEQLKEFADDVERGKHENWQAAGVMQRLVRLPILHWGQLEAIDSYIQKNLTDDADQFQRELSRLRRAVELDEATRFDFEDVMKPVMIVDESAALGHRLTDQLTPEAVRDVVQQAKLVADRSQVPEEDFPNVRIDAIVRRQIELGLSEGTL